MEPSPPLEPFPKLKEPIVTVLSVPAFALDKVPELDNTNVSEPARFDNVVKSDEEAVVVASYTLDPLRLIGLRVIFNVADVKE